MNNKSVVIIAVLAVSVLSVVAITTPYAFASRGDSSETETKQEQKQTTLEVENLLMTTVVRI
jgi:flagellar basal body-associated protein FliL